MVAVDVEMNGQRWLWRPACRLPPPLHPFCLSLLNSSSPVQMSRHSSRRRNGQSLQFVPWAGRTTSMATVKPNSERHDEHARINSVTAPLFKREL